MTLRAAITADATDVFLNTSDFAESISYYPHRYFGTTLRATRTINAVVVRDPIQSIDVAGTVVTSFEVHVANDSTDGISSDEIDTGGDQLGFPRRDGETATRHAIIRIVSQDHGMLVLEVRG